MASRSKTHKMKITDASNSATDKVVKNEANAITGVNCGGTYQIIIVVVLGSPWTVNCDFLARLASTGRNLSTNLLFSVLSNKPYGLELDRNKYLVRFNITWKSCLSPLARFWSLGQAFTNSADNAWTVQKYKVVFCFIFNDSDIILKNYMKAVLKSCICSKKLSRSWSTKWTVIDGNAVLILILEKVLLVKLPYDSWK